MGIDSFKTEEGKKNTIPNDSVINEGDEEMTDFTPDCVEFKKKKSGKIYSSMELLQSIVVFYRKYEKINMGLYHSDSDFPSSQTISNRFGSWSNAVKQAGLQSNKSTGMPNSAKTANQNKSYITGVLLGDGSITDNDGCKVIQLPSKDKEFVNEFGKHLCDLLEIKWNGFDSSDTEVTCIGPISRDGNVEDYYMVTKGATKLCNHLEKYTKLNNIDRLIRYFSDYKSDLLRGLWDSEGSIDKQYIVKFSNSDKNILWLYMELVSDIVGVTLSKDWKWASKTKSGRLYGEFRVTKEFHGVRNIELPKEYNKKFYKLVEPTIRRKNRRFEEYIDKRCK